MSEINRYIVSKGSRTTTYPDGPFVLYTDHIAALQAVKATTCPCTTFEQDEDCPVGFPSMLCSICKGTGNASQEQVVALAAEMLKVAEQVGELEDPFAAWESIEAVLVPSPSLEANQPECCPICGGDCASANPPVMACPMKAEDLNKEFPPEIVVAAERLLDQVLCNDSESCGGTDGLRTAATHDIASALMSERHRWFVAIDAHKDRIEELQAALEANQQEAINLIEWIEDYALADPDLGEIASRAGKARDLLLALLTLTTRTNQRAER